MARLARGLQDLKEQQQKRELQQRVQALEQQLAPPTRPMAHVQQIIVEAAKPLIDAGEKNPTAKLLDVWKSIPGQGEPKDKKERQTRARRIRYWKSRLRK
jgi:hypothetical protein